MHDPPATQTFSVELKFGRKLIETTPNTSASSRIVDELLPPVADQRSGVEGTFTDERLWVDRQPRLAFGAQHVATVEILMDDHELILTRDELVNRANGAIDEATLEGLP
jgi:hypothetical protein